MRRRVLAAGLSAFLFGAGAGAGGDRDAILESGEKLYSQHDEELLIRHFFGDRRGGFFLDVGAGHYRRNSTTYYLEKHLGWSGVAVGGWA